MSMESYNWNGYTATILGQTLVGLQSLDYDSKREVKLHYGKGSEPVGYGRGNYEASGKMSLKLEEYERLVTAALPFRGDVTLLPPFPITGVIKKSDGKSFKEVLPMVLIEKVGRKRKQGDTEFAIDLDIKLLSKAVEIPL